jgi:hypothetical protein
MQATAPPHEATAHHVSRGHRLDAQPTSGAAAPTSTGLNAGEAAHNCQSRLSKATPTRGMRRRCRRRPSPEETKPSSEEKIHDDASKKGNDIRGCRHNRHRHEGRGRAFARKNSRPREGSQGSCRTSPSLTTKPRSTRSKQHLTLRRPLPHLHTALHSVSSTPHQRSARDRRPGILAPCRPR